MKSRGVFRSLDGAKCGYIAVEASADPVLAPRTPHRLHAMGGSLCFEAALLIVYVNKLSMHEAGLLKRSVD